MNVRRSAAVLAAIAVIGTATAPAALADDASPSPSVALPSGLYGTSDPTYDGVWRQSLALLAQDTVGVKPATKAVDWLAGQQCADGGFAAYRADADKACDAKTAVDSNSTAAAVQALAALGGHDKQVGKAVTWLKSVQNEDGGWGYAPGGASDTNSTGVVVGALAAAGEKPADVKSKGGKSPYDALVRLSIPCDEDGGGAFAYQPDKKGKLAANADATAAGVLGGLGQGLVTTAGKAQEDGDGCGDSGTLTAGRAAGNGATYLAETLTDGSYLKSALAGAEDQPDYANTADAVVALAAAGRTTDTEKPLAWLAKNSADWAAQSGPAAYAQLVFAAHAAGADPRAFGGHDLVQQLNATGPAPRATDDTSKTGKTDNAAEDEKKDGDSGPGVWWIIGVGLVAGIGIGFLLSGRNKKQQL
ncbi:terpene cyclase/mutase family protein [Streptomyces sp. PSKA54]|uniref:Terpene cyclase/mutase family protein n=1 Tax=Streptomyces himalayensis subsp. aureolus TaxID=2758039 RepID=A0A7W2D4Z3_9ACTN|nr:prenyltransferase/squalene oxidase repeat-containing protein [Streptomyces himalayensis]MBA4864830.1 terpene cyclase/mutase family protein [Streptomyces himalayensis subsp. aureolus]